MPSQHVERLLFDEKCVWNLPWLNHFSTLHADIKLTLFSSQLIHNITSNLIQLI